MIIGLKNKTAKCLPNSRKKKSTAYIINAITMIQLRVPCSFKITTLKYFLNYSVFFTMPAHSLKSQSNELIISMDLSSICIEDES